LGTKLHTKLPNV